MPRPRFDRKRREMPQKQFASAPEKRAIVETSWPSRLRGTQDIRLCHEPAHSSLLALALVGGAAHAEEKKQHN